MDERVVVLKCLLFVGIVGREFGGWGHGDHPRSFFLFGG